VPGIPQQVINLDVCAAEQTRASWWLSLAKPTSKVSLLEMIEAVDGPLAGAFNLPKQMKKDKYGEKVRQTYHRAIVQAKNAFQRAKPSNLLGGK
jgi:DNA-binding IscR family transcriptional regulator